MRSYVPVIAAVFAVGGLGAACSATTAGNGSPGNDAGDGSTGASPDAGDAAATDDASSDADDGAPQAYVRIANWSPDAPAADVCFAPPGGSFEGQTPVLGPLLTTADAGAVTDAGDAGAPGLTFPQVTSYLVIPPGTYAARLVAAGSVDCSTPLVDLATVTLGANTYTTVAALGEVAPVGTDQALALVSFADDVSAPLTQIALRFINASPSSALSSVDFGTGSIAAGGGAFSSLFSGVPFGLAGAAAQIDAGAVDVNGYLAENALAGATLSVHATNGGQDTTVALNDVTVNAGSAATIALIDGVSNGSAASGAKLLRCADADDSTGASLLASCALVSTQ